MRVVINPGTGSVHSGSGSVLRRNADRNMRALCRDAGCGNDCQVIRYGDVDDDGRYPYKIIRVVRRRRAAGVRKYSVLVGMPGVRLERVRILENDGQNAWDFPRLYIDGNSWLWHFAVNSVCRALKFSKVAP